MYKVFINNTPVFLTENQFEFEKFEGEKFKFSNKKKLKQWVESYEESAYQRGLIYHYDLDELWYFFRRIHVFVKAAGGLVENQNGEYLFIFRKGKWDLPKGKMEKGETPALTALREVEEECGIQGLEVGELIENTYHTYGDYGEDNLKKTYWYKMTTSYSGDLTPQLEEEIEQVVWLKKEELEKVKMNTYLAVIDVLEKEKN